MRKFILLLLTIPTIAFGQYSSTVPAISSPKHSVSKGASPPAWNFAPILSDDENTISHVYWRSGALVDTKNVGWTMNGTVPQVSEVGYVPPGSGPSTDTNYYKLGTGNDQLDFSAGSNFTIMLITRAEDVSHERLVLSNLTSSAGWGLETSTAGKWNFLTRNTTTSSATTTNGPLIGKISFICFGKSGSTIMLKVNLDEIVTTGSAVYTPATTTQCVIGHYPAATGYYYTGENYEILYTTTAVSDALCTATAQSVRSKMKISDW